MKNFEKESYTSFNNIHTFPEHNFSIFSSPRLKRTNNKVGNYQNYQYERNYEYVSEISPKKTSRRTKFWNKDQKTDYTNPRSYYKPYVYQKGRNRSNAIITDNIYSPKIIDHDYNSTSINTPYFDENFQRQNIGAPRNLITEGAICNPLINGIFTKPIDNNNKRNGYSPQQSYQSREMYDWGDNNDRFGDLMVTNRHKNSGRFPFSTGINIANNIKTINPRETPVYSSITNNKQFSAKQTFVEKNHSEKNFPKCTCQRKRHETCDYGDNWTNLVFRSHKAFEKAKAEYQYLVEGAKKSETKDSRQIGHDLPRTYQEVKFFKKGSPGYHQLENILLALSAHKNNLGYVQGMNFIGAAILYHASEEKAFWIYDYLLKLLQMDDIYSHGN